MSKSAHAENSTIATVHQDAPFARRGKGRCQLVVIEGPDMGRAVTLGQEPITVGTDSACQLLLTDERVSREHLTVAVEEKGFRVKDLQSRNGTLYQGSALSEALVGAGATLKLGHTFVRVQPKPEALQISPSQSRSFGDLVAESLTMREVFAVLELAAQSTVTVLLQGDTGTGKELAARAIHSASERRSKAFVAVDCGALPENLLESELFGHLRGAFTGAATDRKGAFLRATGGTLFLDELDSVPLVVQARLLRAVEERKVRPVGADEERALDIRLVAASRANLEAKVAEGAFRPDLYYRLSVLRVELPPLSQRREDIAPIVKALLRLRGLDAGPVQGPNLDRLIAHDWPGNVRELRNVVDRALALSPGAEGFADLRIVVGPDAEAGNDPLCVRTDLEFAAAKQQLLQAFERRYLADLWARCDGNISATARESGIDRKHLKTLLKRNGLL